MHACALADEVGIPRIVIPRFPGVAAALGLLATDIRHDLRRSWLRPTAEITPAELDEELERLEAEAAGLLRASAGVTSAHQLDYELDMRYRGQAYNLTVAFAARPVTAAAIAEAVARFEDEHRRLYDYTPSVTDTEIVTLRLRALARIPAIDWEVQEPAAANGGGRRDVYAGGTTRSWTLVQRAALEPGAELGAETIVEQEDCTTVIPAGWHGRVEAAATLVLEREGSG
jgi:N-methylhydantoinase A